MKHSLLCSLLVFAGASPAWAGSPYLVASSKEARVGLASTHVEARIIDSVASVRLTQIYDNESPTPIEVSYVFPASTQAAVHGLDVFIGSRHLKAKIAETKEAEKRYEKAKAEGKTAALLKEHRPNVFRMRIAHVMPGDRIKIRLRYSELITVDDGQWELVVPSVVGPRYTGEAGKESMPATAHGTDVSYPFSANITVHGGGEMYDFKSPSHRLSPKQAGSPWVMAVDDDEGGNRDLVVRWKTGAEAIRSKLLVHPEQDGGTFALTVHPPRDVPDSDVLNREYIFLLDVSGSMGGFPLATAQSLMQTLLQNLGANDRFNLVAFSGGSQWFAPASAAPTSKAIRRAAAWIHGHHGGGGTNLLRALDGALSRPRDDTRVTTFVVVTDGYVSAETETYDKIDAALGPANVYAFGVGSSVNRHLIESIARAGRGQSFVVTQKDEVQATVQRFARYVRAPVLRDVVASFSGDVYDLEPKSIPDLFAGRPITVMGRYRGQAPTAVNVQGTTIHRSHSDLVSAEMSDDFTALPLLWARTRIARLADRERTGADHKAEILKLALKYELSSSYTSFIAVDARKRNAQGELQSVETVIPLPRGVQAGAVGGSASGTSYGSGGLGVRGTGRGGGGSAYGMGVGSVGTVGKGRAAGASAPPVARSRTARNSGVLGAHGNTGYGRGAGKLGSRSGEGTATSVIQGALSKDDIRNRLRTMMPKLTKVYERELTKQPGLSGKIAVQFYIDARGKPRKVIVVSETIGNKKLVAALIREIRKLRFPKPKGGSRVTVRYPFTFTPDK